MSEIVAPSVTLIRVKTLLDTFADNVEALEEIEELLILKIKFKKFKLNKGIHN